MSGQRCERCGQRVRYVDLGEDEPVKVDPHPVITPGLAIDLVVAGQEDEAAHFRALVPRGWDEPAAIYRQHACLSRLVTVQVPI